MAEQSKGTALVTGAGRGIGRGIALELARRGFDVVVNDIVDNPEDRSTGAWEVLERIQEIGRTGLFIHGDISDADDRRRILDETLNTFERLDVLVNNAGIPCPKRLDILESTEQSYDLVMNVNLRGPFFLTQLVANQMVKQVKESTPFPPIIVFITSISAYVSSPSRPEYCISKAGLSMASSVFADRLSEEGILVYEVRPGIIKTDMTLKVKDQYDKLIAEGLVPQKRWGVPDDIGLAVASIARGDWNFSTGTVFDVSGGLNIRSL